MRLYPVIDPEALEKAVRFPNRPSSWAKPPPQRVRPSLW